MSEPTDGVTERRSGDRASQEYVPYHDHPNIHSRIRELDDTLKTVSGKIDGVKTDVASVSVKLHEISTDMSAHIERSLNSIPNRDPIGHLHDHLEIQKDRAEAEQRRLEFKKRRDELVWGAIKWVLAAAALGFVGMMTVGGRVYLQSFLSVPAVSVNETP